MTVHPASKSTVVKAARHPLNHLVPLKNQLLCRSSWLHSSYTWKIISTTKADKQGHYPSTASYAVRPHTFRELHTHTQRFQQIRTQDMAVSMGADTLLPLVEVGSQWPVAAAVLKCDCRRGDLSSKLSGPVSSSERRWCCSHSHTSTCSLVAWLFWGVEKRD